MEIGSEGVSRHPPSSDFLKSVSFRFSVAHGWLQSATVRLDGLVILNGFLTEPSRLATARFIRFWLGAGSSQRL